MEACREMTVRDYIERLGDIDPDLDRESLKKVLDLYDKENANKLEEYQEHVIRLQIKLREKDIIISCLVKQLERERNEVRDGMDKH